MSVPSLLRTLIARVTAAVRDEPWLLAGGSIVVFVALVVGVGGAWARHSLAAQEEAHAEDLDRDLLDVEELRVAIERKSGSARAFVLTGDPVYIALADAADGEVRARLGALDSRARDEVSREALARLSAKNAAWQSALAEAISSKQRNASVDELHLFAGSEARTKRFELDDELDRMVALKTHGLQDARAAAQSAATLGTVLDVTVTALAMVLLGTVVLLLVRSTRVLNEQKSLLEEKNRELDAFAGRISHDLRNVLSPIAFAAASLRRVAEDPEGVRSQATRIERVTHRAQALLDALLAFSRAGASTESSQSGSARRAVDEALEELSATAARMGAKVECDVEDARLPCSPGLLHLLVLNLAGNAIKFLEGRPERRVKITGRRDGDGGYALTVEDSGPGIPARAIERIFEPFYRVPGTRAAGTGIGLATVRRVVDAHGGRIEVDSIPGVGTTFRVRFPRALTSPGNASATG